MTVSPEKEVADTEPDNDADNDEQASDDGAQLKDFVCLGMLIAVLACDPSLDYYWLQVKKAAIHFEKEYK